MLDKVEGGIKMLKSLKTLMVVLVCMVCLVGCSQPDESLRVQGTRIEVAEEFAKDIQNENYDSMYDKYVFNDNIKDLAKSGRMAAILDPIFSTCGDISSFEESYETETAGYYLVHIPTHFSNGDANILITFDSEDQIYNIQIEEYNSQK